MGSAGFALAAGTEEGGVALHPGAAFAQARWERFGDGLVGATNADRSAAGVDFTARIALHGDVFAGSDARGVVRVEGDRRERAALSGVTAIVLDRAGTVWVGSAQGLSRWNSGARPERRRLFGGEAANRIRDIVAGDAGLAVATDAGLFWSPHSQGETRTFQPLDAATVGAPVERVAIRVANSEAPRRVVELWLARAGAVERIVGLPAGAGLRVIARDRLLLPRHGDGAAPVDLRIHPEESGDRLLLVHADAILHRRLAAPGARFDPNGSWTVERPVLAPGARIQRLVPLDDGGVVAATDRGLFEASAIGAGFRRAVGDPGFESCTDVVSGPRGRPWSRCRSGLARRVVGGLQPVADAGAAVPETIRTEVSRPSPVDAVLVRPLLRQAGAYRPIAPDPPLAAIRERAWTHARLDRARGDELFRGLSRRGFWPEVSLRFGADFDEDDRRHADQTYTSGDTRQLFDRTRDRGTGFGVALEFDWALGEIAYPDDAVDLSREHRQVVSLRDDISDELHQLYFERARLRERLAVGPALPPEEERVLRHRAAELLAGLDAWTGGWLSAWHADRVALDPLHTRSSGPDDSNGSHDP